MDSLLHSYHPHRKAFNPSVRWFQPALFHLRFEPLTTRRCVMLDPVLADLLVAPNSLGPVFRCCEIEAEAAPRIRQQPVFLLENFAPDRIEMHAATRGAQIPCVTALQSVFPLRSGQKAYNRAYGFRI